MSKQSRREQLLEAVNNAGEMSFTQIKTLFPHISEMTLRCDLRELDAARRLVRIYGGAKSLSNVVRADDLFFRKMTRNTAQKRLIAQKALAFLKPGMSFFLDCGTTLNELARVLPDEKYIIVTNSVSAMGELARLSKAEVQFLGGKLNRYNLSTGDPRNCGDIEKRNFDIAFMAVTGYESEHGFTCGTEVDDDLRKCAIRRADKVVVLMDSSKVGRVFPITYATARDIDVLVSDEDLSPDTIAHFHENEVTVV